jgi:hypothetical protein
MLLTALAAAMILSLDMLSGLAEAMTRAAPAAVKVVALHNAFVREVVNVCGGGGCVPVQTHRVKRKPPPIGFTSK